MGTMFRAGGLYHQAAGLTSGSACPQNGHAMQTQTHQNALTLAYQNGYLGEAIRAFLTDRRAAGLSPKTVQFYTELLRQFSTYCDSQSLTLLEDVSADFLRGYILFYAEGHKPGGVHAVFRTLRCFFNWLADEEAMPAGWQNPISKLRPPKRPQELLKAVELADVTRLIETCRDGRQAERDRAVFLTLLDSGIRAGELCALDLTDADLNSGTITIQRGKGGKGRVVFVSRTTRRSLRAYLRTRTDNNPALFVTHSAERMTYLALREMLRRRAKDAGIAHVSLHDFRRAWALESLRSGMDPYSLKRLGGWADLSIIQRYLNQTDGDSQTAAERHSPVDRLK